MSDLQDALDRLQTWGDKPLTVQVVMDLGVAVEAARRVANLDLEAASSVRFDHFLIDADGRMWLREADIRNYVEAALGITEEK